MPKFQGAIFDVDGVLVDSPHQKAWRESLRELMEAGWRDIRDQTTWSPDAFTPHVYQQYVSGKPRAEGGSRSVTVAVRDDVRKLSVGDRTVFELSPATTAPSTTSAPD